MVPSQNAKNFPQQETSVAYSLFRGSVEKSRESFGRGKKNLEFQFNSGMIMWLEGQNKTYSLTLYSEFISRDCMRL